MSSSFAVLGVSDALCEALARTGIDQPFPVQTATLPDALAGHDVCAMAPTGSGKTLAYGLTVLQRAPKGRPHQPSALVLVPTRELAQQVVSALVPMAPAARRYVTAFYGGAGMGFQIEQLRRGVDVAVGTPGRLIDLVRRGELDLSSCSVVVVDEADRMADMGFLPQISELLDTVPTERQVLLFSATLDGDIGQLVERYLREPVRHEVEGQHGGEDEEALAAALRAPHYRVMVKHENKIDVMADLCRASHRSIVFAKNRFASERMAAALEERGVSAVHLHGGMSQGKRQLAVRAFSNGEVKALVATDLAARGLHVDGVSLVVHLDPPQDWKDYIHRSGRTARAGARGVIVNLLRKDQLKAADRMERELGVSSTTIELEVAVKELESIPVPEAKYVHVHVDTDETPSEGQRQGGGGRGFGGRPGSRGPRRFEGRSFEGRRDGFRSEGDRPRFNRDGFRSDGDRPRPPFNRDGDRPAFNRDRRRFDGDRPGFDRDRPRFDGDRPGFDRDRPRPPFNRDGDRPAFNRDGDRPRYDGDRPRPAFNRDGDRPAFNRDGDRRPSSGPRSRTAEAGPVGGPRFAADGSPLNRKARRAMQFGAAEEA
jgi:superfamily II DNA/RNA helicase